MGISAPELLNSLHDLSQFKCQYESLTDWLQRKAIRNDQTGASRTFVICEEGSKRVIGYYCLSAGALPHENVGASLKRNMPNPTPVLVLGRLAIDEKWQGQKLGVSLLKDAVRRAVRASEEIGIVALMVQALDDVAHGFYLRYGFKASPKLLMLLTYILN